MLRLTNLANVYKRRTLRVLYGNTQAYPYAATLSANFDRTANQLAGAALTAGSKAAINPGSVAYKLSGEIVTLAGSTEAFGSGGTATDVTGLARGFGLFANFVGGELDELGTATEVGVWRGPGSVYEILAPAFDPTSLPLSAELGTGATERYMNAQTVSDGRLKYTAGQTGTAAPYVASNRAVVRLISYLSANAIIVECLV